MLEHWACRSIIWLKSFHVNSICSRKYEASDVLLYQYKSQIHLRIKYCFYILVWFGLVYGMSIILCCLMPNTLYINVPFQTIYFSISTYFFVYIVKCKNHSFQTIQFSIIMQFGSIQSIDRTLSGVITLGQSGSVSYGNEGVLCILQSLFSIISRTFVGGILPLCSGAVNGFYSPSQMSHLISWWVPPSLFYLL